MYVEMLCLLGNGVQGDGIENDALGIQRREV